MRPDNAQDRLGLTEYAKINFIPPDTVFSVTPGGKLSMTKNGEEKTGVSLHRAFPFGMENRYISIKDKENKELGMIDKLEEFPADTQKLLREQMQLRYFAPEILSITSIKEDFGYLLWSVETDLGPMMFTTQIGSGSIVPVAENRYLVIDLDGNRFDIVNIKSLTKKDFYKVEMYL